MLVCTVSANHMRSRSILLITTICRLLLIIITASIMKRMGIARVIFYYSLSGRDQLICFISPRLCAFIQMPHAVDNIFWSTVEISHCFDLSHFDNYSSESHVRAMMFYEIAKGSLLATFCIEQAGPETLLKPTEISVLAWSRLRFGSSSECLRRPSTVEQCIAVTTPLSWAGITTSHAKCMPLLWNNATRLITVRIIFYNRR